MVLILVTELRFGGNGTCFLGLEDDSVSKALAAKSNNLSLIFWPHQVEAENLVLQAVL